MRFPDYDARHFLVILVSLGVLAYLPALTLPLLSDDYTQIWLGRKYGPSSGWRDLALDPLYRCRATSILLTYWTEQVFGVSVIAFNISGLVLHVLNTYLVFALGVWRAVGWRVSAIAAAFFAVHEGHQEAVIWYAALPELLVFFFSLLCFFCWILWLHTGKARTVHYMAALIFFVLALLSKESAVVVVPLIVVACVTERVPWRKTVFGALPFAVLAIAYTGFIFAARNNHLHFQDGTFSLQVPVWLTLPNSFWRLFWIWGLLSLLALLALRARQWTKLLGVAMIWVTVTLLPYCFLTYMPRVPSRHTYLASVGLAWIVAAGFLTLKERWNNSKPWVLSALLAVVLIHNCIYLWTRKHQQFVLRAAPTEALIDFARRMSGPIYVKCFPYGAV
jgi:hypothetical protein